MHFLRQLAEGLEIAARFVSAWMRGTTARERFHWRHCLPWKEPDDKGVIFEPFPPPEPVLVSVIILTLNGADMLRALFASMTNHNSWPSLEIIVVDHGGDAATADVLAEASSVFPIRHVVPGRNYSFAFSCNRAAQIARGDVLLFLNNDIEFASDIVPRIVSAVQATKGLVGVKLWYKSADGTLSSLPQIGVRFRWNFRQGWTVPYDARPTAKDVIRQELPAAMPVVTGAVVGCDRSLFLKLGGFCEDYLYAYEDVDLGVKAGARSGMPSISLNDTSVLHLFGATRFRRSDRKRRAAWHRHNRAVFRARNGYRNRRLAGLGLFGASDFEWGRGVAAALIGGDAEAADKAIAASIEKTYGDFVTLKRDSFRGRDLYGYDLLLLRDPDIGFWRMRHLSPMALCVGWARDADETWTAEAADGCHLIVAESEDVAAGLSVRLGRPVHALPYSSDPAAALREILVGFLGGKWRLCLLAPADAQEEARELASALRSEGHSVRLDVPDEGAIGRSAGDDVVIWFSPAPGADLPPDQIHVAAFHDRSDASSERYDIVLPRGSATFEMWLGGLRREIGARHEARMEGPFDPPLADLKDATTDAAAVWKSYPDPTGELILRS
ncbi:MAG: glycosyltransferase [Parvibaculum sp.]